MSNAPSADTDPWDRPLDDSDRKAVSARHKAASPSSIVPDDWDEASSEEDNQKIWDNANKMAPMPDLVVTSSSTGPISSVVPPASAFQSPIRILKRSATSTQNSANDDASASAITETFADRSARYNAARERIFAGTTEGSVDSGDGIPVPVSAIIRNPKGPEYVQGKDKEGSQGFGVRAGKRGSLSQKQGQQLQGSDLRTE